MTMMHTAESYRAQWATLTRKSEREIYVPEALRDTVPLVPGDFIRILEDDLDCANVLSGDVLEVLEVSGSQFWTPTPRLRGDEFQWVFALGAEGTGWERL